MGLCKCPKRKVTNLFCFEHRVNVCEHCLVANHTKCIVKSYLQWLQDSDYNPICTLCNRGLSDENCGGCVRLTCYDVFHWACLNYYAQQMPPHTAPAGYTCPTCHTCVFPQNNMVSPVAEYLKEVLQQVNWARAGLGLPLMEEAEQPLPPSMGSTVNGMVGSSNLRSDANLDYAPGLGDTPVSQVIPSLNNSTVGTRPSAQVAPYQATPPSKANVGTNSHSVISVDEGTSARGQLAANPRKLFDSTKEDAMYGMSTVRAHDHDEDKYKRRPALQWLGQWFNSVDKKGRKDPNAVRKRFAIVVLLGVIGFITIIIIFSKLGRQATEDDPFFDPLANPNIKVEKQAAILN